MKIVVVGAGYVGLANAILLSQHNEVITLELNSEIVDMINSGKPHIQDEMMTKYLKEKELNLKATTNAKEAYENCDLVVIATPTNYDEKSNFFDTSSVESVIDDVISLNRNIPIFIKSTIPVGFVERIRESKQYSNIIFSPEFLREGKALEDNLYPSRIIVGDHTPIAKQFAELLQEGAIKKDSEILFMSPTEAEAVKLFANTYLAMRVAFFNELDTYAEIKGLDSESIIKGIGLDPRIGNHYNNPSFGYGGYCLPKDSKQLLANFEGVPNEIVQAIVKSNSTRKDFIAKSVLSRKPKVVGVFRLAMKQGSDNFRESAVQGIMRRLSKEGVKVLIYEPSLDVDEYEGYKVVSNLNDFKEASDVIITNRQSQELADVIDKVYTRDLFNIS